MKIILLLMSALLMWASVPLAPLAQAVRNVYLSPVDGSGTDSDPYRSRCVSMAGAGNIDLRPLGIARFLCASDTLPPDMTGVLLLGDSLKGTLTDAQKTAIAKELRAPVTDSTVEDLIVKLLSPHLRSGRDGKIKIWLGQQVPVHQRTSWIPFQDGGLVADATNVLIDLASPQVAWATTLATETFQCADSASLTCVHTWTEFLGTALAIVSNAAEFTGATTNEARLDADLATDDMEVKATITAFVNGGEARCGVIGRKDSTATRTYYSGHGTFDVVPATGEWRLTKRVAGTSTTLGTNATDPVANDTVKLRDDGSSHSVYVNDTLLIGPITDTAIVGNTRAGILGIGAAASDSCTMDNMIAYDYPLPQSRRSPILWFN